MVQLLHRVKQDYQSFNFTAGTAFSWSPSKQTITYKTTDNEIAAWSLLHELAHALLDHRSYETDFELLLLEVAAWEKAKELANNYAIQIDEDHVQDCIDTYRDWLYQRSTCPTCTNTSLQQDAVTYRCFNCGGSWTVTASRFCRPYRLSAKQKTLPGSVSSTTFL
jgi:hypothetical protein